MLKVDLCESCIQAGNLEIITWQRDLCRLPKEKGGRIAKDKLIIASHSGEI